MHLARRFAAFALCASLTGALLCSALGCKSEASAKGGSTKEGPPIITGVENGKLPGGTEGGESK